MQQNNSTSRQYRKIVNGFRAVLFAFALSACGGGGGGGTSTPTPPANQSPNAAITVDSSEGEVPLTVTFSASNSSDPDGTIASYAWDFDGNGTTDATTETATFTYNDVGLFSATLRVTDNDRAISSDAVDINAKRKPQRAFLSISNADPTASVSEYVSINDDGSAFAFHTDPNDGPLNRTISFSASPDGQWIGYGKIENDGEGAEFFVSSINGGQIVKINQDIGNREHNTAGHTWSPDSTQIAYSINTGGNNTAREVWLANRDGTNRIKISGPIGAVPSVEVVFPAWSGDGRYIFQTVRELATGRNVAVNVYDTTLGTPNSRRLFTAAPGESIVTVRPGRTSSLACLTIDNGTTTELRITDASQTLTNSITLGSDMLDTRCFWNSDDSLLLAAMRDQAAGVNRIQAFDVSGSGPPITYAEQPDTDPHFSFIGVQPWQTNRTDQILFSVLNDNPRIVWSGAFVATSDGDIVNLTAATEGPDTPASQPSWSPNGDKVAYLQRSLTGAGSTVYLTNPDGTGTVNLLDSFNGSGSLGRAIWSPDGRVLLAPHADTSDPNNTIVALYAFALDTLEATRIWAPDAGSNVTPFMYVRRD